MTIKAKLTVLLAIALAALLAATAAGCFADQLRLYLSRRPASADF